MHLALLGLGPQDVLLDRFSVWTRHVFKSMEMGTILASRALALLILVLRSVLFVVPMASVQSPQSTARPLCGLVMHAHSIVITCVLMVDVCYHQCNVQSSVRVMWVRIDVEMAAAETLAVVRWLIHARMIRLQAISMCDARTAYVHFHWPLASMRLLAVRILL
jgi:hypothetical protein